MKPQKKQQHHSADEQLFAFWQTQLRESSHQPWLAGLLLKQGQEINRRFITFYARLRALPLNWQRTIRRRFSMGLAGAALLLALSGAGSSLPVIHADSTIDVVGTCTLDKAITAANENKAVGTCTAGTGDDTLNLLVDVVLTSALPDITSKITLEGNNHSISRMTGSPDFSVLKVGGGGDLGLSRATISGGSALTGGGIHVADGALRVNKSIISGNDASIGGGIYSSLGPVTVNRSTVKDNEASEGAGIFGSENRLSINYSTISGNTAAGAGGGVYAAFGQTTINQSTVSGNMAAYYGGGVVNFDSSMVVKNSTISDNAAVYHGGGIYNSGSGATITLMRSIISGNRAPRGAEIDNLEGYAIAAGNFNVIGYGGSARSHEFIPTVPSDIIPDESLGEVLSPLAANSAVNFTHALVSGSPAIDVVPSSDSGPYDQRRAPRDADGDGLGGALNTEGDVGAYEYASAPVAITIQSLSAAAEEPPAAAAAAAGGLLAFSLGLWRRMKRKT